MSVISIAILCVRITAALAGDGVGTGSCTDDTPGENGINGYQFMQQNTRADLVMTSLSDVFTHPDGGKVSCITTLPTETNDEVREVTVTVSYKHGNPPKWEDFGQTYRFEQPESGAQYVKMNNTETSGAPSGIYTFIYVMSNCAVVKVEGFGNRLSGNELEKPEERTDASTDNHKPHCIVWEKHGTTHATQNCCEKHFTAQCQPKNKDYEYSPDKCGTPPVEERSEL